MEHVSSDSGGGLSSASKCCLRKRYLHKESGKDTGALDAVRLTMKDHPRRCWALATFGVVKANVGYIVNDFVGLIASPMNNFEGRYMV